jgi:nucleoside-diphosphate-sugar epimerase
VSRVLLTGASGFVGRHALVALAAGGHEVHAVARQRGPEVAGTVWHEADLLAGCEVVSAVEPEILVHLAWYAEHGKFWSSLENLRWVAASLELLRRFAAAGGRRAVIAGSCAEYEWSRERYSESSPLRPATLYGATKHALHVIAAALAEQEDVELAWGRLFFLYGPDEAPERFVAALIVAMLRGEPAPMTEGSQVRDFLHTADAGAAFAALADSAVTGPVNVASGNATVLRELATLIAQRVGTPELLRLGARPMRAGEPPSLLADVRRLREEVGWSPSIGLGEGLGLVISWWRERLATSA